LIEANNSNSGFETGNELAKGLSCLFACFGRILTLSTVVIQSHKTPLPQGWIRSCLTSVQTWAQLHAFDYRFIGDEIFDLLDQELMDRTAQQKVVATDLARLRCLQQGLIEGYERVIWCDADFLVFTPEQLIPPTSNYALGREVWIQKDASSRLRVYKKVHNAFMVFCRNNTFLDFYAESAEKLIRANTGALVPQFIGPKWLSAIHNIAMCPVQENAGMSSPEVSRALANNGGEALDLLKENSPCPPAGLNLCSSLANTSDSAGFDMQQVIDQLLDNEGIHLG
jgi:hypothetical protein